MGVRAIHHILSLLASPEFYSAYIQMPTSTTPLNAKIEKNPKLFPYFKDCIGSIDGTHLDAFVPDDISAPYWD